MREEKKAVAKSLGEALKENRIRCQMTQEFVAETLGVSRQSVSTWENGFSDPNTSDLIALIFWFSQCTRYCGRILPCQYLLYVIPVLWQVPLCLLCSFLRRPCARTGAAPF